VFHTPVPDRLNVSFLLKTVRISTFLIKKPQTPEHGEVLPTPSQGRLNLPFMPKRCRNGAETGVKQCRNGCKTVQKPYETGHKPP